MTYKNNENPVLKNRELNTYLEALLGDGYKHFINALPEAQAIRLNTLKANSESVLAKMISNGYQIEKLPFSDAGFYVLNNYSGLSKSIDFFKGCFAFQGASSQIPPLVLNPQPGERVLDMAASPGSKTTQIAALMQNKGLLVVNDSNINRMQALNSNTQRAGMINHCIYYRPGERIGRLFPEYFDKVLLDTPCSGLGTLATHKEILGWWSHARLQKLNNMQEQLLISAIKSCKTGGEIVYSTCSVAPEENELIIDHVINKYPVQVEPIGLKGLENLDEGLTIYKDKGLHTSLKETRRVWQHKHKMEGFFIARLRKTATYYNKNNPLQTEKISTKTVNDNRTGEILSKISQAWGIEFSVWEKYRYHVTRDRIWLFSNDIEDIIREGFSNGGLLLAEEKLQLWKLSHQAVRFMADKITERRISLDAAQLQELFRSGSCALPQNLRGYYALEIDADPAAIVYTGDDRLKIKTSQIYSV